MVTATITSKGQVTIPKEVRDSLHLQTGDKITFVLHEGNEAVLKRLSKSVDEVFGRLHSHGQPARSVADMNQAIGRRMKDARR